MKLKEQMDLLQMKEITTARQKKNGTRIFQLPIKKYGKYIQVGSFKSGYVRRLECIGYRSNSSYQLNKCEPRVEYYKDYYHNGEVQKWTGKYRKYVGKSRILIDKEEDRLKYLISYCLKNYYIKQANQVEDGKFIPKWKHEYEMENMRGRYEETAMELDELHVSVNGHKYKVI